MERLGLGYAAFQAINPRVVYCSITGYGQNGPRRDRVGHDLNYLADCGALSLFANRQSSKPIVPPNLVADYAGGSLHAVIAILAALFSRVASGRGQYIDVSLAEGALALLGPEIATFLATGSVPKGGQTRLTGAMAHYNVYETSDGRFITLACNEPAFFRELCDVLELGYLIDNQLDPDPTWQNHAFTVIQDKIRRHSLEEWNAMFTGRDIAFAPVRTIDEVLVDQHYIERGLISHQSGGSPRTAVGSAFHFSDTPVRQVDGEDGQTGQESLDILLSLGWQRTGIEELVAKGIVA
jgi:crotonobetainyl-CoA:carnitine CoA-transferase CaiB-like acyl-CoA transferase